MPSPPTSSEQIELIEAAWLEPGAKASTVCAKVHCSQSTAYKYKPRELYHTKRRPAPTDKTRSVGPTERDLEDMRTSAMTSNEWEEPVEAVWQREEERSARAIRKAREASTFRWTAPGKHLLLSILSDLHIGAAYTDYKRLREDAELIRDTPGCFCVLVGDAVDNHIKIRSAVLAQEMVPDKQYHLFEYWLQIVGDKILVVTSGNHDDWTVSHAGVDVLGRIVRSKRVFYAPNEAWMELSVGAQKYVVAVRHQYHMNSKYNVTHAVKQWLRFGMREFDVGVVGHHHEAAIEQTVYRGRHRVVARPGSYQITSGYAEEKGWNHSLPTTPTVLLRGDQHGIIAWNGVREMAAGIRATKELGAA